MSQALLSKQYTYGTHRLCQPEQTFHFISQHFAAVGLTRIADLTGLDIIGIPVCSAMRPNAKSLSVSQGKGADLMLAKVSAAMEAIELYHAENVSLERTIAPYPELAQIAPTCDPQRLNLLPFHHYQPHHPIPWVKGFDLIHQSDIFVPFDLVHCSFLPELSRGSPFFISSNGLASGNHLLEAISHGICEVIERDATHLWEFKTTQGYIDCLDLATVDSPTCQELLAKLEAAGMATYIWSMTADVEIPVFGCAILERETTASLLSVGIFHGFGCHLSKEIALSRAITEAVQSRLTYISGSRDDLFREEYVITQSEFNQARWRQLLAGRTATLNFRQLPSLATNSFDDDLEVELQLLKRAGFDQVIVVDLTQPELGIPVARVIIPGMEQSPDEGAATLSQRAETYYLKELMIERLLTGDF